MKIAHYKGLQKTEYSAAAFEYYYMECKRLGLPYDAKYYRKCHAAVVQQYKNIDKLCVDNIKYRRIVMPDNTYINYFGQANTDAVGSPLIFRAVPLPKKWWMF